MTARKRHTRKMRRRQRSHWRGAPGPRHTLRAGRTGSVAKKRRAEKAA